MTGSGDKFAVGEPYFLLHYFDQDCKFPVVTTLVFIGKNLEMACTKDDLWFFQDPESYLNSGAYGGVSTVVEQEESVVSQVYDFPESQLEDIFSLEELAREISSTIGPSSGSATSRTD